ncbi:DgyrCDS2979 [Dimorphilus gyrociliatus]|uniref:DgyrCDS2979 n=1 Tax=Dimorphilus gyrociliatus TaxID=2664684 RepID=A0A7I8VBU1_9ANNE|nr:DgyrCDS2979 [Dimorphilus gyrociliatus]
MWKRIATLGRKTSLELRLCSKAIQFRQPLGRVFLHQESIPRLPVPPLDQTLSRFLDTCRPLLSANELNEVEKLAKEFGKSGTELQKLLETRAQEELNWLEEWWLHTAYLDYRLPVVVHSSPGILCPRQKFNSRDDQLDYTARLISGVLDYKKVVDNQNVPIEAMGNNPLCMYQYYQILSACRIPGKKRDSFAVYPPTEKDPPRHIIIICNNAFFKLDVYDKDDNPLTTNQLCEQLRKIFKKSFSVKSPGVGILTSENRNTWGLYYDKLKNLDPENEKNLKLIEKSIATVCFDKAIPFDGRDEFSVGINQMNHGCGSKNNSANRWFDKTLQFIVSEDGQVGLTYEHSSAEGPPIVSILDHALIHARSNKTAPDGSIDGLPEPEVLNFNVNEEIQHGIEEAGKNIDTLISDLSLVGYVFKDFGKEAIKKLKVSPDAFIQVGFQLAYNKIYGRSCATYESASLRKYRHGRTDTIRSCTNASHEFAQAMISSKFSEDVETKRKLLLNAINAHRQYTQWAVGGGGVDRHLLGLKLIAKEHGKNIPDLLMEPSVAETSHWKLSTSQVASKTGCLLGFGPVVPDGYGLCYNPQSNSINFSISSWKTSPETESQRMAESIGSALVECYQLLSSGNVQAKL